MAIETNLNKRIVTGEDIDVTVALTTAAKKVHPAINELKASIDSKEAKFGDGTKTTSQTGAGYSKGEADTKFAKKDLTNVNVGVANAGKFLQVKADGGVEYVDDILNGYEEKQITIKEKETIVEYYSTIETKKDLDIPLAPVGYTLTKIIAVSNTYENLNERVSADIESLGQQVVIKATTNPRARYTINGTKDKLSYSIESSDVSKKYSLSITFEYEKTTTTTTLVKK